MHVQICPTIVFGWGKYGQWKITKNLSELVISKHLYYHPVFFFLKKKPEYRFLM